MIVEGKLKMKKCSCGGELALVQSDKNSKYYIVCNECDLINNAVEEDGSWGLAPKVERRDLDIDCLLCGKKLVEFTKGEKVFCACSDRGCKFIVWAAEKTIAGKCECGGGYRHKDRTKSGRRIMKCNNCAYFAWEEKKKQSALEAF